MFGLLKRLCSWGLAFAVLSACAPVYHNAVLGNKVHGLPCDKLPEAASVDRTIAEHKDVVDQILEVHQGFVFFDVDRATCPGKADVVISFGSIDDRRKIEAIIGNDTFFGVPIRLMNR